VNERPPSARAVASKVLFRVAERGAFAAAVLNAELRGVTDSRERALATEIVYGTLRAVLTLDQTIDPLLRRPDRKLDGFTRAALRAAVYQLKYLRVPTHAAVHETVDIVRNERGKELASLTNAVLRRVSAAFDTSRSEDNHGPEPNRALDLPSWLSEELSSSMRSSRASAFVDGRPLPPPIGLRVDLNRSTRDDCITKVRAEAPHAELKPGSVSPAAILMRHGGDPKSLAFYERGSFSIQEEGAQAVGLLVGAKRGERILDACAGRGGKTVLLAAQVGATGHVTALDVNEKKLDRISRELTRLSIPGEWVTPLAVDLTVGTGGLEPVFDRVLVDAPCTGLGTLHRRPEIGLRIKPEDLLRLSAVQTAILLRAAGLVRPGGTLVYAVCSFSRQEGESVAARLTEQVRALEPIPEPWSLDTVTPDDDGAIRLGPWCAPDGDGPDAYQVYRWRRGH